MDLVACASPGGRCEPAPQTGLRRSSEAEQWEGFWVEDQYYARCTVAEGPVQWYRLEQQADELAAGDALLASPRPSRSAIVSIRTRAVVVCSSTAGSARVLIRGRWRKAPTAEPSRTAPVVSELPREPGHLELLTGA